MKSILGLLLVSSLLLNNVKASIPKCNECSVFATGKDGTLWGWEEDSFCKLPTKCSSSSSSNGSATTKTSTIKKTTTVIKKTTTINKNDSSSSSSSSKTTVPTSSVTAAVASSATATSSSTASNAAATTSGNAAANHKKNEAGNYICNGCSVTATGGDGMLWGWEDEESCVIDTVLCKLNTSTTSTAAAAATSSNAPERGSDGILICSTCEYTRIDKDTTTWNKENGEDCRVISSRCGFNKTPHPWCSGCVVTGTGSDGALFGWENSASCLINEITCGFVQNNKINGNSKVETESSAASQYLISIYSIIITVIALLII
ncbi:hypothetical protein BCR36DRAFT_587119 [Piromyces finnis]|uniref:CBM10 domain-containing protein n=1 Tax=Piromyces finnis TaxID=1754191 RepID=A0A1Y1UWK0_9FUNG|nr:hypothetical protein BCR36DRAFT_587119 [Piromyces finnis]|eukprot:ORX42538.1 hypothetical protein BCR36DRAFT_587119 [Piromyces finnis]